MSMLRSYIKPKQCNRQKLRHATLVFVLHLITNESFQLAYFLVYLSRISDGLNEKTTKQITNVSLRPTFKLKHSAGTCPPRDQKHRNFFFGLCFEINTCITDSDKPTWQKKLNKIQLLYLHFQLSFSFSSLSTLLPMFNLLAVCIWHKQQPWTAKEKRDKADHLLLCQCVKHWYFWSKRHTNATLFTYLDFSWYRTCNSVFLRSPCHQEVYQ